MRLPHHLLSLLIILIFLVSACAGGRGLRGQQVPSTVPKNTGRTFNKQLEFEAHFYEGLTQKMIGNYERAAEEFEAALKVERQPVALYELASAYYELSEFQKAQQFAKEAVAAEPENIWYNRLAANLYEYFGQNKEAGAIYQRLIELKPNNPNHYHSLANSYLKRNQLNEALKVYDEMEQRFGVTEPVMVQKQKIFLQQNKVEEAAAQLERLIERYPEPQHYERLAQLYRNNGLAEKAEGVYLQMLEIDSSGSTLLNLAQLYMQQDREEEAMELYQQAFNNPGVSVDQKVALLYNRYLTHSIPANEQSLALNLAELVVEAHPNEAKVFALQGDLLYQVGKSSEARESYRKSVALRQDVFAVWQQLLYIESELADWEALAQESEEALAYFPNQPVLYFFNGIAQTQQGNTEEAIEMLQMALEITYNNPQLKGQIYTNMAEAYHKAGRYSESDEAFDEALKLNPVNPLTLNNYAYYLSLRGANLDKAEKMSKQTLAMEPNNPSYLDTYGWILYQQEKYSEAKLYISKALQQQPNNPELLEHMGDVLFRLGQQKEAFSHWEKALKFRPDSESLTQKLKEKKLVD